MNNKLNEGNVVQKAKINKTQNKDYPYNVQILNSIDGGKTFYYTGEGEFFETKEDVRQYIIKFKIVEGLEYVKNNFIYDEEKINNMLELSRREFLRLFSEITEQEYENTKNEILHFVRSRKQLYKELNQNIKKEKLE